MSGEDEEDKQFGKIGFIRKDAYGNQIIKNKKKYKVSFADTLEKSSEELTKKALVEIVEIDCYKEYNKFKITENDGEDRNYANDYNNDDDDEEHDSSDPGRSCVFF